MLNYSKIPITYLKSADKEIASFITNDNTENIDWETVESFGIEWEKFDQFSGEELKKLGDDYFDIADEKILNQHSYVLDVGCGSGRWTMYVANKVKFVEAIDPSKAVLSAAKLLNKVENVRISHTDVSNIPFEKESFDFVFSLGVLHHIPDTKDAMRKCVEMIKKDGYFLVYLYYDFENRSVLFKFIFHLSNSVRKVTSNFPAGIKKLVCDLLAVIFYMPFILLTKIVKLFTGERFYKMIPLFWYHDKTWNVIRNDALDRFGTPLEQRFNKAQIKSMMESCGLREITFSENAPYWHAIGKK